MSSHMLASSSASPNYVAHENLWFHDGPIVLLATAPKENIPIGFRVHAGMLILHSPWLSEVLKEEFGLSNVEELLDVDWSKCEKYIVLDDHPVDVEYWLIALYDGLHFQAQEPKRLATLRAVLMLSKKYETVDLYQKAYDLLLEDYPTNPSDWVKREKRCYTPDGKGCYHPLRVFANPIHAIRIARELNLPEILTSAFYDLSRWPVAYIQLGARPLSGGEHIPNNEPERVRLNHRDFVTVLGLKDWLKRYICEFVRLFVDERSIAQHCETPDDPNCTYVFTFVLDKVMRMLAGLPGGEKYMRTERAMVDPLLVLERVWIAVRQKRSDIFKVNFRETTTDADDNTEKKTTVCCRGCAVDLRNACFLARDECWFKMAGWLEGKEEESEPLPIF